MLYIEIPEQIDIRVGEDWIKIKGPLGSTIKKKSKNIKFYRKDNRLYILNKTNKHFYISLVYNLIWGLLKGYKKQLQMVGVGYKANVENDKLVLKIGYSHDVYFNIPENITINILKNNIIEVLGNDKIKVNQTAANIRALKAPEPFKGKGIRYINETIVLKEGKKTNV